MKVTVLGCGALGQLWLTALCKQGHEVQGWLRVPQPFCSVNVIETDGSVFNESLTANDPDFLASSELLIVTLKAWQVSNAVKHLAGILPVTTPIVLVHNGMGTVEELRGVKQPLLLASTTQAARRDGNVIIHVAQGTTHIGPAKSYEEDYSYLAEVLQSVVVVAQTRARDGAVGVGLRVDGIEPDGRREIVLGAQQVVEVVFGDAAQEVAFESVLVEAQQGVQRADGLLVVVVHHARTSDPEKIFPVVLCVGFRAAQQGGSQYDSGDEFPHAD